MIPDIHPTPPPLAWIEPVGNVIGTAGVLLSLVGALAFVAYTLVRRGESSFERSPVVTYAMFGYIIGLLLAVFASILLTNNFAYLWAAVATLPLVLLLLWIVRKALNALGRRL